MVQMVRMVRMGTFRHFLLSTVHMLYLDAFAILGSVWVPWSLNGANGQNGQNGYFQTLVVLKSADGLSRQHAGHLHLGWACFITLNQLFALELDILCHRIPLC